MIQHTFQNFIMPLSHIVLGMGLYGVNVDKEKLRELRKRFELEQLALAMKYRQLVFPLFKIEERWNVLLAAQQVSRAMGEKLSTKPFTELHKKCISWLNPGSSHAQRELFYDIIGLPVKRNRKTGKPTMDEEAILKLSKLKRVRQSPQLTALFKNMLEIREVMKKISTYCLKEGEKDGTRKRAVVDQEQGDPGGNEENPWSGTGVF